MLMIIIDNEEYDPYFILDVTENDPISHITKIFRQKAKLLHPDKLTIFEKKDEKLVKNRIKHFKILIECYEYIISKTKQLLSNKNILVNESEVLNFDNDNDNNINKFNENFIKARPEHPNDYGYTVERIEKEEDYDKFNYKPNKLFNTKNFNPLDFNKAFEYQKSQWENESITGALIHKTSDDFYGYNTADLNGIAIVNSYNGILITGDNFGQTGLGYSDGNYSDYKQTFNTAKNPDSLKIPDNFNYNPDVKKLSKSESDQELRRLQELRTTLGPLKNSKESTNSHNKNSIRGLFKLQEQELLKKQEKTVKEKEKNDKQFITQYKNLYKDTNLIEDALSGKLINDNMENKKLK